MATIAPPLGDWTVADLLDRFGPIPFRRIRQDPPPGFATEDDVVAIHDRENRLYELIDGILVEKTLGYFEGHMALLIGRLLGNFVAEHNLGVDAGADGMMRLFPGMVRIPDVSFVAWDRITPGKVTPRVPRPDLAPHLAVVVLSVSNTKEEMDEKLADYFEAGVLLVWYVDPRARVATAYTSTGRVTVLNEGDTLDGGAVLPGFALPLKGFFDEPEPPAAAGQGGEPGGLPAGPAPQRRVLSFSAL